MRFVLNGTQWQYDNNDGWVNFTSVSGDRLLAAIDFTADTITSLEGTSGVVEGIDSGYDSGDIVFTANQWNGGFNDGEFGITGTFFEVGPVEPSTSVDIGALGFGVAAQDDYSGTGYLLYTSESVFTRFASSAPHPSNATNLIAVRLEGTQWQYDNNDGWVNFTSVSGDRLLAAIDFTADTITSLEGTSGVVEGIDSGYDSGDIVFTANQWNGGFNDGEFGITGTFFEVGPVESPVSVDIGALGFGVAAQDDYSGTGYLLYTSESVFTRFASSAPHPSNATNLIAVRLER